MTKARKVELENITWFPADYDGPWAGKIVADVTIIGQRNDLTYSSFMTLGGESLELAERLRALIEAAARRDWETPTSA